VAKLASTLKPYVALWTTLNAFYNAYAGWLTGPFWRLVPETVEAETADALRCVFVCGGIDLLWWCCRGWVCLCGRFQVIARLQMHTRTANTQTQEADQAGQGLWQRA
jgi:hypothetical protein